MFGLNAHKFRKTYMDSTVSVISILSIITTFFLALVMALREELPHFFQLILMIHKKKSGDGRYIIGWDRETCFPSLELYTVYVAWITDFQKRAGENETDGE